MVLHGGWSAMLKLPEHTVNVLHKRKLHAEHVLGLASEHLCSCSLNLGGKEPVDCMPGMMRNVQAIACLVGVK